MTVIERSALPLAGVLGDRAAQVFTDLHRENGVNFRLEEQVHSIVGAADSPATTVILESGAEIDADLVVVGVGALPNTDLAAHSGLEVNDGIMVDEHLRTADPAVFAAGDVARAFHPLLGRHVRVEHWANAVHQPVVAARSMMGRHDTYERLPTSTPTSTTSEWSTSVTPLQAATTMLSSAAMLPGVSSSRFGSERIELSRRWP